MGKAYSRKREETITFLVQGDDDIDGKCIFLEKLKQGTAADEIYHNLCVKFEYYSIDDLKAGGWGTGGRSGVSTFYRHLFTKVDGIINIIDTCDMEKIDENLDSLNTSLLQDEYKLNNKVVMVLFNKQENQENLGAAEIKAKVGEKCKPMFGMSVFGVPCSLESGEGVVEAFGHFAKLIQSQEKKGTDDYHVEAEWLWELDQRVNFLTFTRIKPNMPTRIERKLLRDPIAAVKSTSLSLKRKLGNL